VARPFYITTPIYYVNDAPHIGHAYTTINCDAVARWHRLLGDDTFFLTGTDEHGLKIQRAAEEAGLTPRQMADKNSARYAEAWAELDISHDRFIRTTDADHYAAVQALLQKAYDNGHIEEGYYEGPYCVSCEGYYSESELIDGDKCPIHLKPTEIFRETNYFFRLSRFEDQLRDWLQQDPSPVRPEGKRNEALGLISLGLQDVSITRTSLTWGVPVPWDDAHVFYVWFDALINYATAAGYGTDPERFARWWPVVNHVLAKDIIRFHAIYWPAMLMAAGEAPPHTVNVHGFLLIGGEKMSKTRLNQIAPHDLVEDFGVDPYRYHFLRDVAFGNDGDFSYEGMVQRYNSDLANNLGNLLSRVATVVGKKCEGTGPAPDPDSRLKAVAEQVYADAADGWERIVPSDALDATWRLIRETNAHLEEHEPWKMAPGPDLDKVLGDALEVLRIVAILGSPAMPSTMREVWARIGLPGSPDEQRLPEAAAWGGYPGGLPVVKGDPLFPRIQAS
jgi:methionyl-tRNA synthetase